MSKQAMLLEKQATASGVQLVVEEVEAANDKSEGEPENEPEAPNEGCDVWVTCLAASFLHVFAIGFLRSGGLLIGMTAQQFHRSVEDTAWIFSCLMCIFLAFTPVTMSLCKRLSPWKLIAIGGVCLSAGFSLSSIASSLEHLYFTMGALCGLGMALSQPPALFLVNSKFERRRALANGVTMAGASIGAICCPPLLVALVDAFAFRGGLLVLGGCVLNILVAAALMRTASGGKSVAEVDAAAAPSVSLRQRATKWLAPLRRPRLWLWALALAVATEGFPLNMFVLPQRAVNLGLSESRAALLLQLQAAVDFVARLLTGLLADGRRFSRHQRLMWLLTMAQAALWLAAAVTHSHVGLFGFCLVEGVLGGAVMTLVAPCLVQVFGLSCLPIAYGLSGLLESVIMLGLPPLLGRTFDSTGSWDVAMVIVSVALATVGAAMLVDDIVSACGAGDSVDDRDGNDEEANACERPLTE